MNSLFFGGHHALPMTLFFVILDFWFYALYLCMLSDGCRSDPKVPEAECQQSGLHTE